MWQLKEFILLYNHTIYTFISSIVHSLLASTTQPQDINLMASSLHFYPPSTTSITTMFFFITKASLVTVLTTTLTLTTAAQEQRQQIIDLSSYGYNYVQNTASSSSTGWITWSPSSLLDNNGDTIKPYKEYTLSKHNITTVEQCASKCSTTTSTTNDNAQATAQFGSWHEEYGTCHCITLPPSSLCREPCLSESLMDFSTNTNFNSIPWCTKSYCNKDWFYDEMYCTVVHTEYDSDKCNVIIKELMIQYAIDNESELEVSEEDHFDNIDDEDNVLVVDTPPSSDITVTTAITNDESDSDSNSEDTPLSYCLLIKTLSDTTLQGSKTPDGYITFQVDIGSGYPHTNITELYTPQDDHYNQDEVVFNNCYPTPIQSVQVYGPDNNGWRGNVLSYYSTSTTMDDEDEESADDNSRVYVPMICIEGCTGETNVTAPLAVDGNDNGGDRTIANCLNGHVCILSVASSESNDETDDGVDEDEIDKDETEETGADGEVSLKCCSKSLDINLFYISKLKTQPIYTCFLVLIPRITSNHRLRLRLMRRLRLEPMILTEEK